MKFKYRKSPDDSSPLRKWISRPMLQVRLFYGSKYQDILALIDSGADHCLFHSSIADLLGIDLKSGEFKEFYGIAEGLSIEAYMHDIQLQIQGFSEVIDIRAGFTDSEAVAGLLGQAGFFDNYQIIFERYKGRFRIVSRPPVA